VREKLPIKKWIILLFVFLYFLTGVIAAFPNQYYFKQYLEKIPPARLLLFAYDVSKLPPQYWPMFAPPPKMDYIIKYSVISAEGWGPLTEPFSELKPVMEHSFLFIPRGLTRLFTFLRTSNSDRVLHKSRSRKFFFHQLSNYFCHGRGRIPGAYRIRFYIDAQPIPPFYTTDQFGEPLPDPGTGKNIRLLYERDCLEK
jgi:hypothetical protein